MPMPETTTPDLLAALRAGRSEAWQQAFTLLWPHAYKSAYRLFNQPHDAEESASHALQEIYRRGPRMVRQFDELIALTVVIARRHAATTLRARLAEKRGGAYSAHMPLDFISADNAVLQQPESAAANALDAADLIAQLDPEQQRLLEDHFWNGFTSEEIARRHQMNPSTARSKIFRAVQTLRRRMDLQKSVPPAAIL